MADKLRTAGDRTASNCVSDSDKAGTGLAGYDSKGGSTSQASALDDDPRGMSLAEMSAAISVAEKHFWRRSAAAARNEIANRRYLRQEPYRMFWKSPAYTLGYGIPALLALALQFCVPWLLEQAGIPEGNYTGYVRLALLLLFVILAAVAAPAYRPNDWHPSEDEQLQELHEQFRDKFQR